MVSDIGLDRGDITGLGSRNPSMCPPNEAIMNEPLSAINDVEIFALCLPALASNQS